MKCSTLLALLPLVSGALAMTQEEADKWCVDNRGPGFVAVIDANGEPTACNKSEGNCFGNPYKDPVTGKEKCCPVSKKWSFDVVSNTGGCCAPETKWNYNAAAKAGDCCATGHSYQVDAASGKGSCCVDGKIFDGTNCKSPEPPIPPIDPIPPKPPVCESSKPHCSAACQGKVACPSKENLGIQYGKCYVLAFLDGVELGRQRNGAYEKNGRWQGIPFRVCTDTFDCKPGKMVTSNDKFSLQDQLGIPEDPTGAMGWFNNAAGGNHAVFTKLTTQAAKFSGRPGCIGNGCSICINQSPSGFTIACPDLTPGLTQMPNPNFCERMVFQEVDCLSS